MICAFYGLVSSSCVEIWFYTTLNMYNMNTHQTENIFIGLLTRALVGHADVILTDNELSDFHDYLNFIGPLCFKITFIHKQNTNITLLGIQYRQIRMPNTKSALGV